MTDAMLDTPIRVQRQTVSSRMALTVSVLFLIAMVSMPWWASPGKIRWAIEFSCYLAIAQMWNLLAGYAGLVSVGQQAFIGVCGLYDVRPVPELRRQSVPGGAGCAWSCRPSFRCRPTCCCIGWMGHTFAIGTWVVAEVFRLFTSNLDYVNTGAGLTLRVMAALRVCTSAMWA